MKKTLLLLGIVALGAAATLGLSVRAGDTKEDGQVTSEFQITGMTCGGCAAGVKMAVKKLDGVAKVEASYDKGNAVVTYDPDKVTSEQIKDAIKKLGYEAEQKMPEKSETSSETTDTSAILGASC